MKSYAQKILIVGATGGSGRELMTFLPRESISVVGTSSTLKHLSTMLHCHMN